MRQDSLPDYGCTRCPSDAPGNCNAPGNSLRRRARKRRNRGFILLEVMVALTMLALVLTPLAAMVYKITTRSHRVVGNSYRNAVLMDEVNYLESLPYDSLRAGTTTTTVSTWPYPHTRTVVVVEAWQQYQLKLKTVRLVITPTNLLYRPDTVSFIRSVANTPTLFTDDDQ
ncbi:MAG TPA: prepilin-type N-terminal cleavage/methylation domain-containing protein [Gemmatimonadaceae bacterium]|nr:prepilin-type N-terminal cleavage/methylation domain-containing protein [Gemmatimonadaceae bacterium]